MSIRAIILGLILIFLTYQFAGFVEPEKPSSKSDQCTRYCFLYGCDHFDAGLKNNFGQRTYEIMDGINNWVIKRLHNLTIGGKETAYEKANRIVYIIAFPLLALFVGIFGWRPNWSLSVLAIGGVVLLALQEQWFRICTDFCIHWGNWTGLTYHGFTFLLLIVAMPAVLLFDLAVGLRKGWRWVNRNGEV